MTERDSAVSRRAALGGAGVLGAAAVTGCAAGQAVQRTDEPFVVPVGDIPVGGGTIFAERGTVITQPEPGRFLAFSTACSHRGCAVTRIAGATIVCPCHGSTFRITDGSVANGPAREPLTPRTLIATTTEISVT